MLIRGVMRTRDNQDELAPGDMFFFFDNTLHYNQEKMMKCFLTAGGEQLESKEVKKIYITIDEDSLRSRKGLVRQGASFDQIEVLSLVTSSDIHAELKMNPRKHFPGTNLGNKIGDVLMPDIDNMWKTTCKEKIIIHGSFRIACGNRTPGEDKDTAPGRGQRRTTPDTIEPVFWHGRSLKLYEELIFSYDLKAIIDFTPGDGTLLNACARRRLPYMCFGLSECHNNLLKQRAITSLLESCTVEGEAGCCSKRNVSISIQWSIDHRFVERRPIDISLIRSCVLRPAVGVRWIIGAMAPAQRNLSSPSRNPCRSIGQDLYDPKIAAMMRNSQVPKPPPHKKLRTAGDDPKPACTPASSSGSGGTAMDDFKKKLEALRAEKGGGEGKEGGGAGASSAAAGGDGGD
eukprot:3954862-Pyramimonas_sp.AAC.1